VGVCVIGAGSRRGWIARLVPPVGASIFLTPGIARDGRRSEGCGIGGRTMDPRWNVAPKRCQLFSLFIYDEREMRDERLEQFWYDLFLL
jgi:hypothetical protein